MNNININYINYITYQFFPNEKANSLQTINTLNSFVENGIQVKLIYPDRDKLKDNKSIDKVYEIDSRVKIIKTNHKLPFGKTKIFEKFFFIFSSLIWSVFAVLKYAPKNKKDLIYTRTPWVLLCSIFKKNIFIFECHKYSLSLKLVLKLAGNKDNVLLIFTNSFLKDYFKLENKIFNNSLIVPSAFSETMFEKNSVKKIKKEVVFVGNLLRFNKDRNISFLINAFQSNELSDFKLSIIGGPDEYIASLKSEGLKNINFIGQLSNRESLKIMQSAEIGILINDSEDVHSYYHTSPLKFFEYIRANLKVVAVNFPSHKLLPFKKNITFFNQSDQKSFIQAILNSHKNVFHYDEGIHDFSYNRRTEIILAGLARLEGLEPPTT